MTLTDIAPRLARAHAAELRYQRRKAEAYRRGGVMPLDIAAEEMVRTMKKMARIAMKRRREMPYPSL